jgi:hypothetical protein
MLWVRAVHSILPGGGDQTGTANREGDAHPHNGVRILDSIRISRQPKIKPAIVKRSGFISGNNQ